MPDLTFLYYPFVPLFFGYFAFAPVFLAATVWALVEAARARTWRWAVTIVLLQPYAAFAWFVAGRRFYRRPPTLWRGWITEATSAGRRRGG